MTEVDSQNSLRSGDSARSEYAAGIATAEAAIAEIHAKHVGMIWIRTAFFAIAAICLLLGYGGDFYRLPLLTIGWLAFAAFFVAIVWHERLRLLELEHRSDLELFKHLVARLDRDWSQIPTAELNSEFADVAFADDLDIGGDASLLTLICLANTQPGKLTLQRWLMQAPSWSELHERQAAIRALQSERPLRLSIVRTIRAAGQDTRDVYGLPEWARSANWLETHPLARALGILGPALVLAGVALVVVALLVSLPLMVNIGAVVVASGFLINIGVTIFWGSWIHDIFLKVTGEHQAAHKFASVFSAMEGMPKDGGLLDNIRAQAVENPSCAKSGFTSLLKLVRLANFQRDPTLYLVYLALQLTVLWDFRILKRLEAWKTRYGQDVEKWFEALGQCEALVSGATLADEYPGWAFPTDVSDDSVLTATRMGHPLLSDEDRVPNDLELDRGRPLLLVTGSNMAGKSTFLRSIGLNIVLSRIGAPVCAERFECPLYELATSIRIRDSLKDGVSFFMAELNRLKEVVDTAKQRAELAQSGDKPAPILFLLDEILQGTNSIERQIAVTSVLEQLLATGAIGMISTHDLDLATAEEIVETSQVVHFREYFEEDQGKQVMRFDYRMRPGTTPTTNALKLLEMVGLRENPTAAKAKS